MSDATDAQACAEKCAALMMAKDNASRALGMHITFIAPGQATLTMPVQDMMLNGHGTCHGGYIFTLADSAFAFACNTYNQISVAQNNQITYTAPAYLGDMLTATATQAARAGRSGTYDVRVTNPDGDTIALFRGMSRTIKGHHFPQQEDRP